MAENNPVVSMTTSMVRGYQGEATIVKQWEAEFKTPIVTAAQTQVEALRALGIRKFVGVTYFTGSINEMFTRYFQEAGFEVLAMEGMEVAFADVGRLASTEIYAHTHRAFLKNTGADGIYMKLPAKPFLRCNRVERIEVFFSYGLR